MQSSIISLSIPRFVRYVVMMSVDSLLCGRRSRLVESSLGLDEKIGGLFPSFPKIFPTALVNDSPFTFMR